MKTRDLVRGRPASRFSSAGLLARLMDHALPAGEPRSSRRRQWQRALAESLLPPGEGLPERAEWVGTRENGIIAVPRDG